jgi:glycosyltransferase involved in cell wall biosynthesis
VTGRDKHILILSSWYPSDNKPFLGNFVKRQASLLGSYYKVTVLHIQTSNVSEIELKQRNEDTFEEIIVNYNSKGNALLRKRKQLSALLKGFSVIENVDIIIGNILLPDGWQFLSAKKRFKCPLLYVEHGSYFRKESPLVWSNFYKWIRRNMNTKADEIITVSNFLKKDLKKYFNKRDIQIIGNHVDMELFQPKKKQEKAFTNFLHVSTLDKNIKNPSGILEACALLKKENVDFKMTIICDEDTFEWKTLANDLGLKEQVEFIGPLVWEELAPYYHIADAFVLFSYYETFSIVLVEAMATGTPIISTDVGIAQNLDERCGQIVEQNNINDLKNKMRQVVLKDTLFNTEYALKEASKYSNKTILNAWKKIIAKHIA